MGDEDQVRELEKVMRMISDPTSRRSFFQDPAKAMNQEGVNRDVIPQSVIDALSDLSWEELRVLASFNKTMLEAGLGHQGSDIIAEAV